MPFCILVLSVLICIFLFHLFLVPSSPDSSILHQLESNATDANVHQDAAPSLELNYLGVARSSQFPPYQQFDDSVYADVCFFLQLSESSIKLAPRLLRRVWHPDNVIIVHIDTKVNDSLVLEFNNSIASADARGNVHMLHRETVTYAGISLLLNTLNAMEFALQLEQTWDYFINLSGSDYPLVSVDNIRNILGQPRILLQRVSFVQLCCGPQFWAKLKRYRFHLVFLDSALGLAPSVPGSSVHGRRTQVKRLKQPRPKSASNLDVQFVHSEAWVIAHRIMVHKATRSAYARRLLALLTNSFDPEEHFFAMLMWNTKLNRTTARQSLRKVFWNVKGKKAGQHPFFVDVLKSDDGDYLLWKHISRAPDFFTRKFKHQDSQLMDRIDAKLSGVAPERKNETSVRRMLARVRTHAMCLADIERHWFSSSFNPCHGV